LATPPGDQAASIADRIRSSSPGQSEAYVERVIDGLSWPMASATALTEQPAEISADAKAWRSQW